MRRRYVYDAAQDSVVEVGAPRASASPVETYTTAEREYRDAQRTSIAARAGDRLTQAALEKAERRVWAHKKHGTETRWAE